jgi:hypothetical protein
MEDICIDTFQFVSKVDFYDAYSEIVDFFNTEIEKIITDLSYPYME